MLFEKYLLSRVDCKLEFAYRAQRFQVSAQAARFKKEKDME